VYVRPFAGPGAPVAITRGGGAQPLWTRDGREICYRQGTTVMAVDVTMGAASSTPRLLFRGRFGIDFETVRDGSGFLMTTPVEEQVVENQLMVVLNWFPEFLRRMQARH
jgi:hypothetical protein